MRSCSLLLLEIWLLLDDLGAEKSLIKPLKLVGAVRVKICIRLRSTSPKMEETLLVKNLCLAAAQKEQYSWLIVLQLGVGSVANTLIPFIFMHFDLALVCFVA